MTGAGGGTGAAGTAGRLATGRDRGADFFFAGRFGGADFFLVGLRRPAFLATFRFREAPRATCFFLAAFFPRFFLAILCPFAVFWICRGTRKDRQPTQSARDRRQETPCRTSRRSSYSQTIR